MRKRFRAEDYEPIDTSKVPEGLRWKPAQAKKSLKRVTLMSFGNVYKLVRNLETGDVEYFVHKESNVPMTSKEKIDAEPAKRALVKYHVGHHCWYIDEGGFWFLMRVTGRDASGNKATFSPVTGWDADRMKQWMHGDIAFITQQGSPHFRRLRPLGDRRP